MSSRRTQGRARKPTATPANRSAARRRLGLLFFGVLLIALFVIVAVAQGLSNPSPSGDEVAVIDDTPDGTITREDLDGALEQTAAGQGLNKVPPEDDPQYELLRDAALDRLIIESWLFGWADEEGIEITDREIDEQRETVIQQEFGGNKRQFERFLKDSGYDEEETRRQLELQLISTRLQERAAPAEPEINDDEIETYYEENKAQFEQPESRDVRVILTKKEGQANEALAELERNSNARSWEKVARKYSTDEATKNNGGLRQAVVEGQSEPALDEEIFSAPEGELVGPFETESGWYVIQVDSITPASTTSLDEAREQIRQTLVAARQQELGSAFERNFVNEWRARTFCAAGYRIARCANADPPENACTDETAKETGCPAPVPSTRPIEPGTAGVFGAPNPTGRPQGPITPAGAQPELPPGLEQQIAPGTPPPGG